MDRTIIRHFLSVLAATSFALLNFAVSQSLEPIGPSPIVAFLEWATALLILLLALFLFLEATKLSSEVIRPVIETANDFGIATVICVAPSVLWLFSIAPEVRYVIIVMETILANMGTLVILFALCGLGIVLPGKIIGATVRWIRRKI